MEMPLVTKALQGDNLFKLDAVAKGAAGRDDGVGELQPCQLHFHVGFHARQSSFSVVSMSDR
jgi:hypothetical protein